MNYRKIYLIVLLLNGTFLSTAFGQKQAKIYEAPLTIPTYEVRSPEKAPMFYHGRAYQGAEGHIYPYPFHDELTDKRIEKEYQAIYLENQYIKVCVLPEIGGRILYARDKSNGYDFIYHQHVIKPALIGMLGAWISGGIEWDLPHHHRARVFQPVDYKIEAHDDGSKTLWIGELELRDRMRWIIGLTVYPDKSYFEAEVKMFNQTPVASSFLSWANVATHATRDYQILFPPGTDYVTYHSKNQFTTWPESDDIWRGVDYTDGVDLSWWKNHPAPHSFFAWNYEDDFFGGYDHGKEAGIAYVANHHVAPGKKFFLWGPGFGENTHGAMWNKILTEHDGPYVELMAGGYSDNQPDYCWLQPYETKSFKWYWYPLRQIKGMKQANLQGAVNIEAVSRDSLMIAANTTTPFENARLILEQGDETLFNRSIDITPVKPFQAFVAASSHILKEDYHLKLLSSDGKELVTYHHEDKASPQEMPDPVEPPQTPEEIETIEELYLTGLRIEQFHNPSLEPYPYYEEALKRDPDNFRVNRSLGILYYKRGMMQKAKNHLVNAVDRITRKYTRPRDGEAHYYLGLTHKYLGNNREAYDAFYRSTWDYRFNAPAFFQLARLDCINRDFAQALEHIQRSMDANNRNYKAFALKAGILRQMGRYEDAIDVARQALQNDPLHPLAGIELYLAQQEKSRRKARQTLEQLYQVLQANKDQTYLEVATHYMNCGLWQDGQDVLSEYIQHKDPRHPMIYYFMGYLKDQTGETGPAKQFYNQAASMSPDYCFPLRLESLKILNHVIDVQPRDDRAHYYLGNLLFYYQQEDQAIAAWERSMDLNNTYVYTHRNLGMAYDSRRNDLDNAIRQYKQAIEIDNSDPRLFAELARLYQKAEVPFKERLQMMESHLQVVELRDDALSLLVQIYTRTGQYDKAIDYLKNYHFRRWEGGGNIRNIYVNAYLMRGLDSYQHHHYQDAMRDFEQALEYPENIEAAKRYYGGRRGQIYYFMGMTHKKAGDQRQAEQAFKEAVSARKGEEASFQHYYEALALQELGMQQKADEIFVDIIQNGKRELQQTGKLDFFAKFGEKQASDVQKAEAHFLTGIGYLGSGNREKARREFEKALKLDMDHLWAGYYLK